MEKYKQIAKLTDSYLEGKLQKLTMEYVEPKIFKIHILYEDNYDFFCYYDLELDYKSNDYHFLGHSSLSPFFKTQLEREQRFEHAVFQTLCNG